MSWVSRIAAPLATAIVLSVAASGNVVDAQTQVQPPINPLPSLYELRNNKSLNEFNLRVPPPINPLPRKSAQEELFTESVSPTTSSKSKKASTNKKKSSTTRKSTSTRTASRSDNQIEQRQ